jgi:hypothetical protein
MKQIQNYKEKKRKARSRWLEPIVLSIKEAEIQRFMV